MSSTNHHEINRSAQNVIPTTEASADPVGEVQSPLAAIEAVRSEVASWEGVTTHEHRFGGMEFRLGRRELGHLHGSIADLPFPKRVRDERIRPALSLRRGAEANAEATRREEREP